MDTFQKLIIETNLSEKEKIVQEFINSPMQFSKFEWKALDQLFNNIEGEKALSSLVFTTEKFMMEGENLFTEWETLLQLPSQKMQKLLLILYISSGFFQKISGFFDEYYEPSLRERCRVWFLKLFRWVYIISKIPNPPFHLITTLFRSFGYFYYYV